MNGKVGKSVHPVGQLGGLMNGAMQRNDLIVAITQREVEAEAKMGVA